MTARPCCFTRTYIAASHGPLGSVSNPIGEVVRLRLVGLNSDEFSYSEPRVFGSVERVAVRPGIPYPMRNLFASDSSCSYLLLSFFIRKHLCPVQQPKAANRSGRSQVNLRRTSFPAPSARPSW